ncbi:hypothetical protein NE237_008504 [Protea cynaroides]|uniref:25.3 kDa vesicle transport protein n=1 Tax=Protea cynaroides TaxID=273540 RepID=A0A9Q0KWV7_9MAGN|nr:hypothetical protein NE237_008504 [Protea cynaroides]
MVELPFPKPAAIIGFWHLACDIVKLIQLERNINITALGCRVCYLTMCDQAYPKKLAFQYLEDLKNEFERVNGNQIETAARPYAFIKFDTFIQKTKKLYLDTRTQRNLAKLNDELYEVHQIMTRNVQEVLGVGEKLDQVSQLSSRLTSDTRIYADKARDLNRQAFIRKWAPVAIVIGVVILLFWSERRSGDFTPLLKFLVVPAQTSEVSVIRVVWRVSL